MSALNRTRLRIQSLGASTGISGLPHSRSAGTLAALCTNSGFVSEVHRDTATPTQNARQLSLEKQARFASLGHRSSLRRRPSNPFSPLGCTSGNDIGRASSCSLRRTPRAASFNLSALSPVGEQVPLLPLKQGDPVPRGDLIIDVLSSSVASIKVTVPESSLGSGISSSLGPTLSSASSLHSLASLLSTPSLHVEPTPEADRVPPKSKLSASLVPQDEQEVIAAVPESPVARARRCARRTSMFMQRSREQYTFCARVPKGLSKEMVTVYIKRGYRLAIVADAWYLEHDAHYTWEIAFTPVDVNLRGVHVVLDVSGNLTVTVPRRQMHRPESCALPVFL